MTLSLITTVLGQHWIQEHTEDTVIYENVGLGWFIILHAVVDKTI